MGSLMRCPVALGFYSDTRLLLSTTRSFVTIESKRRSCSGYEELEGTHETTNRQRSFSFLVQLCHSHPSAGVTQIIATFPIHMCVPGIELGKCIQRIRLSDFLAIVRKPDKINWEIQYKSHINSLQTQCWKITKRVSFRHSTAKSAVSKYLNFVSQWDLRLIFTHCDILAYKVLERTFTDTKCH